METWHIWVILALILVIVEIFTSGFVIICFAVGSAAAAVASYCSLGIKGQLLWFSVATFLAFIAVRPLHKGFIRKKIIQMLNFALR